MSHFLLKIPPTAEPGGLKELRHDYICMCAVLSVLFKTIQIKAIQNFAILFVSCVLPIENIFHMSFYIGTNGVPEITKIGFY